MFCNTQSTQNKETLMLVIRGIITAHTGRGRRVRGPLLQLLLLLLSFITPKQYSTQQKSNRLKTQYADSVYRTEIFPLSHAASTKCSHMRDLIAYRLRFRGGMLYMDRIIPTSFLFILAKVTIII